MAKSAKQQQQPNGKRAAIYARVSDKSQDTEDKTPISEQIAHMEAHCQRRGLTIAARYQEVGRGWTKNRPEFQRMLADARKGRFDTIVCWKSDRLSRGMYPAAALMEVVEAYQIGLEAVMDAIDMKTFGLMAAIGKIELDNFRERASMGKRGSAKQGRIPVNNVPFGYRLGEDRRPQVVEAEAEIIRRVFHMYVREGMGAPAVARQLTAEGVPTPQAVGRWYDRTVTRILGTEAYRGTWWFGKVRHVATGTTAGVVSLAGKTGPGHIYPLVNLEIKPADARGPAVNGMCGRFSLIADIRELQGRFEFDGDGLDHVPRYNVAPTQPVLAVMNGYERQAAYLRWGLIPSWAKSASVGNRMINARAETVAERTSFRAAFARRRCLVLADGFYEWQRVGTGRKPMRIVMKSGEPFAFAGLWDSWRDPGGEAIQSCTIITTEPNELLSPIHDRMPVILPRELEPFWLDDDIQDATALCSVLTPYPPVSMKVYEVSSLVNRPSNDSPEVVAPVEQVSRFFGQGQVPNTLF